MNTIRDLIDGMPKAELHMHLEGAIEPAAMLRMAKRNAVDLPYPTARALAAAFDFQDLQSFLDLLWIGNSVLHTRRDFHEMTLGYLTRAHQDNVLRAEVFISPQAHLSRGVSMDVVMDGILEGMREATARFGISVGLIAGIQRHRSEREAFETIDLLRPYRDQVLGIGLGSAEQGNPPAKFERVFAQCHELGWYCVAHAGEEGPAAYVQEAVDVLKVHRIDHGVRCVEDPALTRRLADLQIPLTVCPVSNVKLKVFSSIASHNLKALLDAGLRVTVNSDDPVQFQAYVNDNFAACYEGLQLTEDDLFQLARNSFEGAFVGDEERSGFLASLDAYRASHTLP